LDANLFLDPHSRRTTPTTIPPTTTTMPTMMTPPVTMPKKRVQSSLMMLPHLADWRQPDQTGELQLAINHLRSKMLRAHHQDRQPEPLAVGARQHASTERL
jgi:hypothetical protein